jgi:hypothetical protein
VRDAGAISRNLEVASRLQFDCAPVLRAITAVAPVAPGAQS